MMYKGPMVEFNLYKGVKWCQLTSFNLFMEKVERIYKDWSSKMEVEWHMPSNVWCTVYGDQLSDGGRIWLFNLFDHCRFTLVLEFYGGPCCIKILFYLTERNLSLNSHHKSCNTVKIKKNKFSKSVCFFVFVFVFYMGTSKVYWYQVTYFHN